MNVLLPGGQLNGHVTVPQSKSLLHRHLICCFLADGHIENVSGGDDIAATVSVLRGLRAGDGTLPCGRSGATLRLLLPVTMALGRTDVTFTCDPQLLRRPVPAPLPMEKTAAGYRVTGPLRPGRYALAADETSQIISGLLLALPLLNGDSEITLTTPAVSRPYLAMTVNTVARFGVTAVETSAGYHIPGGQHYRPAPMAFEGDWSAAAWYLVYNALRGESAVTVDNLPLPSLQGDSTVMDYVNHMPEIVTISDTPDLLPPLALLAALSPGKTTRFTGGVFLRGKESDRLAATAAMLNALGGSVEETADGLTVTGISRLRGGTVDSRGDHRMAMLAAFAALFATGPVTLQDAQCVTKSYPLFWEDYTRLGGKREVLAP
ncbi:MAG: 3-phosphoshikimate 1-carboxyvinyltransferase [Oscillospiraceae bacterium]|nr:3-phosphoshikimate 1-carboxyvinyltransferase [Oscillospiraceae bacterium]